MGTIVGDTPDRPDRIQTLIRRRVGGSIVEFRRWIISDDGWVVGPVEIQVQVSGESSPGEIRD